MQSNERMLKFPQPQWKNELWKWQKWQNWPLVRDKTSIFMKHLKNPLLWIFFFAEYGEKWGNDIWIWWLKKDLKGDCRDFCSIKDGGGIINLIMTIEKKIGSWFFFLILFSLVFFFLCLIFILFFSLSFTVFMFFLYI